VKADGWRELDSMETQSFLPARAKRFASAQAERQGAMGLRSRLLKCSRPKHWNKTRQAGLLAFGS